MIPVQYYSTVYHIIISIFIIVLYIQLSQNNTYYLQNKTSNQAKSVIMLLIALLFIGLRNPHASSMYLGDTGAYARMYEAINDTEITDSKDMGFAWFMKISSYFLDVRIFYLLCAFLYVYPVYITFKKWFHNNTIYALALYIASMSFWAFGINGVRNGLAASFLIFSLGFMNKQWLMYFIVLISISFHKSMLLPVVAFLVSFFLKRTNTLVIIWLGCIAVSYLLGETTLNFVDPLLDSLEDKRANIYSNMEELEEFTCKSFRFDFVLYSAVPIVLGWYYKNKKKYSDIFYDQLLNTYIIANSVWILFFMFAPFTNRYAYLSWFLMPVIMIYPLLKKELMKKQYQFIGYLILGNLVFTLIMWFK